MVGHIVHEFTDEDNPLPQTPDDVQELADNMYTAITEDMTPGDVYSQCKEEIASYGEWEAFRIRIHGYANKIYVWNRELGSGFQLRDDAGQWHQFVNLLAAIVEEEGDCRDADIDDHGMINAGGTRKQTCTECGDSWTYC